ncbi:MAG TPA: hypothetical protein VL689_02865, partial [Paraburkholderia sp.]|nr:hypothetical protein [Paraburkholderia sp.]
QSVLLSAIGLAAVGVFTSLFNGRSALFSATRQIVIGLLAAAFTAGAAASSAPSNAICRS